MSQRTRETQTERWIPMDRGLVSARQAAHTRGGSVDTIRRLIEAGDLKAVRIRTRLLLPRAEIERVVRDGTGGDQSPETGERGRSSKP